MPHETVERFDPLACLFARVRALRRAALVIEDHAILRHALMLRKKQRRCLVCKFPLILHADTRCQARHGKLFVAFKKQITFLYRRKCFQLFGLPRPLVIRHAPLFRGVLDLQFLPAPLGYVHSHVARRHAFPAPWRPDETYAVLTFHIVFRLTVIFAFVPRDLYDDLYRLDRKHDRQHLHRERRNGENQVESQFPAVQRQPPEYGDIQKGKTELRPAVVIIPQREKQTNEYERGRHIVSVCIFERLTKPPIHTRAPGIEPLFAFSALLLGLIRRPYVTFKTRAHLIRGTR